jgi:hypothetical protein
MPEGEPKMAAYRRVRDEIHRFVESLPASLARFLDEPTSVKDK